jgi:NADP-dependent 3-hydroxy acid dehydrogenase YdfG
VKNFFTGIKDIERVVDVDFWGVVNGTKAFLPHLIESGAGHVINISSLFGLLSVPGQSAYNAAKFAVRGFTESLRQEMIAARKPVTVTCVHPGGIKTGEKPTMPSRSVAIWQTPPNPRRRLGAGHLTIAEYEARRWLS